MRYILDSDSEFGGITSRMTDERGVELESLEIPVGPNEIRKGLDVRAAGDAFLLVRRRRLGHMLCYHFWSNVILSTEVVSAFDTAALTMDPTIFRWPLHIRETVRGNPHAEFQILWPAKRWEVLDLDQSIVEYWAGSEDIRRVKTWILDETRIPSFDLFATAYGSNWIVTERFKQLCEEKRFEGLNFIELISK